MSYNPGGWNDDKLKVYTILAVVAVAVLLVLRWLGIIE